MTLGKDSHGVREYPPPCRHTKALTERDLKIKTLEGEIKWLQEHKKQAEAEARQLQFDKEEEVIRREHCEAVIASQRQTIHELEEILKAQQGVMDSIFGERDEGAVRHLTGMA